MHTACKHDSIISRIGAASSLDLNSYVHLKINRASGL